jgi:hypothetical protein
MHPPSRIRTLARLTSGRALTWGCALLVALGAIACSIAIRRDLSAIPPGQIGFDDMCSLQEYFDTIEARGATAPMLVSSLDLEGQSGDKAVRGGRARYAFEGAFQLKHLRRVLNENWRRLPDPLMTAKHVELEVKWSERAGVRRVVTDQDAELSVDMQIFPLPYHVCLSELLFGEPLYRQRRVIWGLPLPVLPAAAGAPTTVTVTASPGPAEAGDAGATAKGDAATDGGGG